MLYMCENNDNLIQLTCSIFCWINLGSIHKPLMPKRISSMAIVMRRRRHIVGGWFASFSV